MKRNLYIGMVLILFSIFIVGTETFAAKSLYDDFSGTYIDSQKWDSREFVRVAMQKIIQRMGRIPTGIKANQP